jgi:hypothetical protein
MRFCKERKKGMMSQETPSIDRSLPTESSDAISALSAVAYGFMGSQALFAALEIGLFTTLSDEPCWQQRFWHFAQTVPKRLQSSHEALFHDK